MAGGGLVLNVDGGGGSGGGGAALPTAPLGQLLISQGAGIAPIFSDFARAGTQLYAGAASIGCFLEGNRMGFGGTEVMRRDVNNGTLVLSATDFMITVPERTLAGLYQPSYIGTLANISDSTVNTPGSIVAGGGSFHVLARWDGVNWTVVNGILPSSPTFSGNVNANAFIATRSVISDGAVSTWFFIPNQLPFSQMGPQEYPGALCNCVDSNTGTPGATIAAGGSFNVLARWNGTVWKVVA